MITGLTTKDIILELEKDPLKLSLWRDLAALVKHQEDVLSTKTLEVITAGLEAFLKKTEEAALQKVAPPEIPSMARMNFSRLAKAYNSPNLLMEIGKVYLQAWRLPLHAVAHLERARQLGGAETTLRPLIEAAQLSAQKEGVRLKGGKAEHSGVTAAVHTSPAVSSIISKSGKLSQSIQALLPPRTTSLPKIRRPAPEPFPDSSEKCAVQAVEAVKTGDFDWAMSLLQKANEQPLSSERMWHAWSNLGLALFEARQFKEAEEAYEQASRYGPERMISHFNLGTARHMNGNLSGALVSYHRAEALEPKHPKIWCNLGVLLCQQDEYTEAELALKRAVALQPDYARAWDNLAVALGAQDRLEESLAACYRALDLKPGYPEACFKIGVIKYSRHQYPEAITSLERAADLPVLAPYARAYLVLAHARLGQTTKAQSIIDKIIAYDPKFELLGQSWNALGVAYTEAKNFAAAIDAFNRACELEPEKAENWFDLGVALQEHDEPKKAQTCFQKAVHLQFNYPLAWRNLGLASSALGQHAEATAAFQQEVRLSPENPLAWYNLGVSLDREGLTDKARMAYIKADELEKAAPIRYVGAEA